jgi:hypothetical protein
MLEEKIREEKMREEKMREEKIPQKLLLQMTCQPCIQSLITGRMLPNKSVLISTRSLSSLGFDSQ